MHLRIVFFPFLLRFIEILESHWLISLISFRKFPNIAFFQILLFPHSLVFFLCVPIIFILNLFIMSLSLFCVFSFFFLCVYHFGNLLLLCLLNYYCSFQQVQSIVIINLSISLFLLLYFPHSFFFLTDQWSFKIFSYFHKHINNNYFMFMFHYSDVWTMCESISIANILGHLVLLL